MGTDKLLRDLSLFLSELPELVRGTGTSQMENLEESTLENLRNFKDTRNGDGYWEDFNRQFSPDHGSPSKHQQLSCPTVTSSYRSKPTPSTQSIRAYSKYQHNQGHETFKEAQHRKGETHGNNAQKIKPRHRDQESKEEMTKK